jgi:hypothetical protein
MWAPGMERTAGGAGRRYTHAREKAERPNPFFAGGTEAKKSAAPEGGRARTALNI